LQLVLIRVLDLTDANKKPAVHLPPLNHIGLWVDDIHAAVKYLGEQGVRFAPGALGLRTLTLSFFAHLNPAFICNFD
jgi:hypothetical protein